MQNEVEDVEFRMFVGLIISKEPDCCTKLPGQMCRRAEIAAESGQ
jgi:hypothetical protein